MRYRHLAIASGLTAGAIAVVAGIASGRLPAGTQLPTHWGPDGLPDRFADAGTALFMPVWLTIAVSLVMAALPAMEPLQDRLERSAPLYRTAWIGVLAVMALVEAVVAAPAFGIVLPATTMLAAMGLLLVVIGNALPKSRPGFFVGIRTPWAIVDEDNWVATHRYASRITIGGGLGIVALALLPMAGETRASFVIAILAVTVATPFVYSYFFWRMGRR